MHTLNKIERIAHRKTTDKFARRIAIENMLIAYRETPHPVTGISPYQAIRNREIRTKLDYINPNKMKSEEDKKMEDRDASYKMKNKLRRENRNTKEHNFITGDYVLVEQPKKNKWTTPYEPAFYVVARIQGSTITARRITDGREITRDGSRFKLANSIMQEHHEETSIHDNTSTEEDWRGELLHNTSSTTQQIAEQEDKNRQKQALPPPPTTAMPEDTEDATPTTRPRTPRPTRIRKRPVQLKDYVC